MDADTTAATIAVAHERLLLALPDTAQVSLQRSLKLVLLRAEFMVEIGCPLRGGCKQRPRLFLKEPRVRAHLDMLRTAQLSLHLCRVVLSGRRRASPTRHLTGSLRLDLQR